MVVPPLHATAPAVLSSSPLVIFGIPLLGRFRKKRTVDQTKVIAVGDLIPDVDVEVLQSSSTSSSSNVEGVDTGKVATTTTTTRPTTTTTTTVVSSIRDVLGNETAILVGMPGAFTPTCTRKHLPGYIDAAPKLASIGIDKIAIVTTNDRFVNEEWSNQFGLLLASSDGDADSAESSDSSSGSSSGADDASKDKEQPSSSSSSSSSSNDVVTILCDGDGDLVRSLGLAEDMGFGVGIRSKRFVLVAEQGVVTTLLVDEGMDDCSKTSAESLMRVIAPELLDVSSGSGSGGGSGSGDGGASPINVVIGGGIAIVALLLTLASSSLSSSGGSSSSAPPTSSAPPVVRTEPTKYPNNNNNNNKASKTSSFNLLNEYL